MRRTLSDTTPIDPASLTECPCGVGRAHLRCDHDAVAGSDPPVAIPDPAALEEVAS